jgi:hypothetical protein
VYGRQERVLLSRSRAGVGRQHPGEERARRRESGNRSDRLSDLGISSTNVADLSPLGGLGLAHLNADQTKVASLAGLVDLPLLRTLRCSRGSLTSLGAIDSLRPALLDVTMNPLSPEALLTIDRLCGAGWAVFWDGGTCGSPCQFQSCTI